MGSLKTQLLSSCLYQSVMFWGSQDYPQAQTLLGKLTELRKAILLTVMVYYSTRIQIKINRGKIYIGQGPGDTRRKSDVCVYKLLWQLVSILCLLNLIVKFWGFSSA